MGYRTGRDSGRGQPGPCAGARAASGPGRWPSRRPADSFGVTHCLADSGRLRPARGAGARRERASRHSSGSGLRRPGRAFLRGRNIPRGSLTLTRPPRPRPSAPPTPAPRPSAPPNPASRTPCGSRSLRPPRPDGVLAPFTRARRPLPRRMGRLKAACASCRLMFCESPESDMHLTRTPSYSSPRGPRSWTAAALAAGSRQNAPARTCLFVLGSSPALHAVLPTVATVTHISFEKTVR